MEGGMWGVTQQLSRKASDRDVRRQDPTKLLLHNFS
jgi:hypothetical protein